MTNYQRTLHSNMDPEFLFEVLGNFFISRGYILVKTTKPEKMEFRKKGTFFAVHDINTTYKLVVVCTDLNNSILVNLFYTFPQCAGVLTSKSVHYLNDEADSLATTLYLVVPKGDGEKTEVQPTNISRKGKKPFSYCPYCGKELGYPETPQICPHCNDFLVD